MVCIKITNDQLRMSAVLAAIAQKKSSLGCACASALAVGGDLLASRLLALLVYELLALSGTLTILLAASPQPALHVRTELAWLTEGTQAGALCPTSY